MGVNEQQAKGLEAFCDYQTILGRPLYKDPVALSKEAETIQVYRDRLLKGSVDAFNKVVGRK